MAGKRLLLLITCTAWTALVVQLIIMVSGTPGNGLAMLQAIGRFFLYFTILSNILVAAATSMLYFFPRTALANFTSRPRILGAVALYILIVGLVYNLVLRPLWDPKGWQLLVDNLLHVVVPVLYLLWWTVFASKLSLTWTDTIRWLLFPFLYLVYALVRGALESVYPYPFIDVGTIGFRQVMINSAFMLAAFIVSGLLLVWVAKKMEARGSNLLGEHKD